MTAQIGKLSNRRFVPSLATIKLHALPATLSIGLALAIIWFSYRPQPVFMEVTSVTPSVVRPGDTVTITWRQHWTKLCPITVTRQIIGSDSFVKNSVQIEEIPPPEVGSVQQSFTFVMPHMPSGDAFYRKTFEPHCGVLDHFLPRKISSPPARLRVMSEDAKLNSLQAGRQVLQLP